MVPRRVLKVVDSTQRVALALARAGEPIGTRVVARAQTEGAGRGDHRWASPPGGLYLSVIGPDPAGAGSLVPVALGAGLLERLEELYGLPLALQWPNDLLLVGASGPARKLGGILTDRVALRPEGARIVVGLGLNVAADPTAFPPELAGSVAQLAEEVDPPPPLEELEGQLAERVLRGLSELASPEGRAHALARARRWLYGRGRIAYVDGHAVGPIQEIGEDGALWLATEAGPLAVRSGQLAVEAGP